MRAGAANILAFVMDDVLCVAAENAGGLVLFQHDLISIHIDFQGILYLDIHGAAQFNGQHNTAQFINLANNTGRLHV